MKIGTRYFMCDYFLSCKSNSAMPLKKNLSPRSIWWQTKTWNNLIDAYIWPTPIRLVQHHISLPSIFWKGPFKSYHRNTDGFRCSVYLFHPFDCSCFLRLRWTVVFVDVSLWLTGAESVLNIHIVLRALLEICHFLATKWTFLRQLYIFNIISY